MGVLAPHLRTLDGVTRPPINMCAHVYKAKNLKIHHPICSHLKSFVSQNCSIWTLLGQKKNANSGHYRSDLLDSIGLFTIVAVKG